VERDLEWEGCFNVRDLGGLPAGEGGTTRPGALVRSDAPGRLTGAGWAALRAYGIATIVDLRDESERDGLPARAELATVHVPVLDLADEAFWADWRNTWNTPRFYRAILERFADRFASAVVAVARANPGGVLVHCQAGRDRTGLVTALLLSVAGVPAKLIAADYALSAARLRPLYERLEREAGDDTTRERLRRENASEAGWLLGLLAELDVESYLLHGGTLPADLAALRSRLVGDELGSIRSPPA
jgi:protein-tyrosine phosphatase